jgi:hypothetical protein
MYTLHIEKITKRGVIMKKSIAFLLASSLLLGACGSKESVKEDDKKKERVTVEDSKEKITQEKNKAEKEEKTKGDNEKKVTDSKEEQKEKDSSAKTVKVSTSNKEKVSSENTTKTTTSANNSSSAKKETTSSSKSSSSKQSNTGAGDSSKASPTPKPAPKPEPKPTPKPEPKPEPPKPKPEPKPEPPKPAPSPYVAVAPSSSGYFSDMKSRFESNYGYSYGSEQGEGYTYFTGLANKLASGSISTSTAIQQGNSHTWNNGGKETSAWGTEAVQFTTSSLDVREVLQQINGRGGNFSGFIKSVSFYYNASTNKVTVGVIGCQIKSF